MDYLVAAIQANAGTLRHLHFESIRIRSTLIQHLIGLRSLKLKSFRILDEDAHIGSEVCESALVRYINGEGLSQEGGGSDADEAPDMSRILRLLNDKHHIWSTTAVYFEDDEEPVYGSDVDEDDARESIEYRRRNAPKWIYGYSHSKTGGQVHCTPVSTIHPKGHPTKFWNFTHRDGSVQYGSDPFEWFSDWDVEAGDLEEPTPFCARLREFYRQPQGYIRSISDPPEGAFIYNMVEDPTQDADWRLEQGYSDSSYSDCGDF